MIKNLPVRLKMALLYVNMVIFTLPIMIVSYLAIQALAGGDLDSAARASYVTFFTIGYPAILAVYLAVTLTLGRKLTKSIAYPISDLAEASKRIASGDVDIRLAHESKDEIGVLVKEFRLMIVGIQDQASTLKSIAEGDYTGSIKVRSEDDIVNQAISLILKNNNQLINELRTVSRQVSGGAAQIAGGAQNLASGSTQQASAIEEFSTSLSRVQTQSQENNRIAAEAFHDTQEAGRLMGTSIDYMKQMTDAMQEISESSKNIARVIKVIEDIALQTRLLSLNASIEAARAGQHGKGFAVVADEVRNLAAKTAESAMDTTAMIEKSLRSITVGSEIASKTSASLTEVGKLAAGNAESMRVLSDSSDQQNQSISEITAGIVQISTVIQANSASAEESAASAQEMSSQSEFLDQIVSRFKLAEQAAPSRSSFDTDYGRDLPSSPYPVDLGNDRY